MKRVKNRARQFLALGLAAALALQLGVPSAVFAAGPDSEAEGIEVTEEEAAEYGVTGDAASTDTMPGIQTLADEEETTDADYADVTYTVTYHQTEARSMLDMVNEFRQSDDAWYWNKDDTTTTDLKGTLSDYTYDYELEKVAMQRAAEIAIYFSHTRPDGETCWTAYTEYDYGTSYKGENIAGGQRTAQVAYESWREDNDDYDGQGHRRNMLDSAFTHIGIAGVYYNGYYYWVQEFSTQSGTYSTTETTANDSETDVTTAIITDSIATIELTSTPDAYTMATGDSETIPTVSGTILTTDSAFGATCNATNISAEWSIEDSTIVSLSEDTLTALQVGQTALTADVLGKSLSVPIAVQKSISECTVTLDQNTCTYDGTEQRPTVTVKDGDTILTEGTDYTVSYSDNVNVGTAKATITGTSNGLYGGSTEVNFTINAADISTCTAELDPDSYDYDGSEKKPTVTVTNASGNELAEGTDFTVSYGNNTDAGTATVTITGQGNYEGTLTASFTITAADVSGYSITLSEDTYTYDGTAKVPEVVTVSDGSNTLEASDYKVSYENNTDAGTATVTVEGTGNYSGTIKTTFTITKRDVTPSITGTTTKVYDGTTVAPQDLEISLTNVVEGDDVTAVAKSYAYDSADVASATKITASGITLSGSAAKNYELTDTEVSVSASITKAEVTISFADGYSLDKTYDDTSLSVPAASDLVLSDSAAFDDLIYEWYEGDTASGTAMDAPTEAGTYTLVVRMAEDSNYMAEEVSLAVNISKAGYTPETICETVIADQISTGISVDVSDLIKDGGTVGTPTADGELVDSASLSVSNDIVTFDTTAQSAGSSAKILVPVTGCTNYEDYEITIVVTAEAVTFEVSGSLMGYTGISLEDTVITITIGEGTGTFAETLIGEKWITNLPAGLSQSITRVDESTVEIFISGTPEEIVENTAFEITIPAGNITGLNQNKDLEITGGEMEINEATYTLEITDVSGEFDTLTYGYTKGSSVIYTLTNTGNQTVGGINASAANGQFTAEVSADNVKPGESITVTVTTNTGLNAGNNEDTLSITWNNAQSELTEILSQIVEKAVNNGSAAPVSVSKTYDAEPAAVEIQADFGVDTAICTWYDEDRNILDEAPKDVGSYSVEIIIPETDNYTGLILSARCAIELAMPAVTLEDKTAEYTGSTIHIDPAEVTLVNGETYDGDITYTYYTDKNCTQNLDEMPTEVGTYYVVASIEASGNYTAAQSKAAVLNIVEKAAEKENNDGKSDGTGDTSLPKGTTVSSGGNTYKVTSGTEVAMTKTSTKSTTVTIPATITVNGKKYNVTSISNSAFSGNTKLKTVTVGNNVTSIGSSAFSKCTNLTTVTIGSKVTSIGNSAFSGDKKLTKVTIGSNATSIGDSAFANCSKLKKVTIPAKVTKIGKKAFYNCKSLKTITIKTTKLKSVGAKAFKGIKKNAKFKVPKSKKKVYKKLINKKAGYKKTMKIK